MPLAVLAVITAVPLLSPSTTPFWSTEATLGLLEDQAILAVRPRGFGVAVRVRDSPLIRVAEVTSRVRPVTLAEVPVTVTWQFLLRSPTWAVITALPGPTAVTIPLWSTVATEVSEELHWVFSKMADAGERDRVRDADLPTVSDRLVLDSFMPVRVV